MQKKIIALAIASAFAAPVAMADVTVYGVLDGGLRSVTTGGVTSNTMGSGTKDSNRFGLKSSEDLGDGMKANVQLEGDITTGTGAANATTLFSRAATVGLEGGFGKIDLGHQYTTAFKVNTAIDPFGHNYIGITSANLSSGYTLSAVAGGNPPFAAKGAPRNDNDVAYTGKFGDVTVMAQHSFGPGGQDYGSASSAGAIYAAGPVTVAASYTKTKPAAGSPADMDVTHLQVGAGFNFGDGNVKGGYSSQENANTNFNGTSLPGTTMKGVNMWIGADYNVTPKVNVAGAYYKTTYSITGGTSDLNTTNMVVAAKYALSKKTSLYVEADKQSTDTTPTTDSNGYAVGMSVAF